MKCRGIPYQRQCRLTVQYKGRPLECSYVADLLCFGQVIVELKAIQRTTPREEAQLINYLSATQLRVGLLINFGDPGRLDWTRLVV